MMVTKAVGICIRSHVGGTTWPERGRVGPAKGVSTTHVPDHIYKNTYGDSDTTGNINKIIIIVTMIIKQ